jgi:hypothetical protein
MTAPSNAQPARHTQFPLPSLLRGGSSLRSYRPSVPGLLLLGLGLLLAASVAGNAYLYLTVVPTATHVQNVFVTIGGRPAVILSGDVVFDSGPLAAAKASK